jgi:hypothetical protein
LNVNHSGINIIKFNKLYDLGADEFAIDARKKAPTTNYKLEAFINLGADAFARNLGAKAFIGLAKKRLLQT